MNFYKESEYFIFNKNGSITKANTDWRLLNVDILDGSAGSPQVVRQAHPDLSGFGRLTTRFGLRIRKDER